MNFHLEVVRQDTKIATLYELRIILKQKGKKDFTLEELYDLLDEIVIAKEQEM